MGGVRSERPPVSPPAVGRLHRVRVPRPPHRRKLRQGQRGRARSSDRTSLRTVPALAESPRASTSSGCCWRTDEACSRASTLRSVSHRSPPRCTRSARLSGSSTTATSSALITSGSAATVSASSWRRPTLSEQLGASGQARVGRKRTRHPRPTRLRGRGRPSPQTAGTSGTASVSHTRTPAGGVFTEGLTRVSAHSRWSVAHARCPDSLRSGASPGQGWVVASSTWTRKHVQLRVRLGDGVHHVLAHSAVGDS